MPAASWAQIEKLVSAYSSKPCLASATALDKCLKKAEGYAEKISRFFVQNHVDLADASMVFCESDDGKYPDYACAFDEDSRQFRVNPVGVVNFYSSCHDAVELLNTPEGRGNGNYSIYRLNAYKAELRKLPCQMHLFLLLFQEMARVMEVTYVERRRATAKRELEKSDADYLNLLWAFKALEEAFKRINGSDIRTDFNFIWFESEWITGKQ